MKTTAQSEMTLLDHLQKVFQTPSKTTLKQWIARGNITINGNMITNPSVTVSPGDEIAYTKQVVRTGKIKSPYPVLYEDDSMLVAEKPVGLLTVGNKGTGGTSFYKVMQSWLKERSRGKEHLFVVHRLDREVSGILVFAKSEEIQEKIKNDWSHAVKRYYALTEGYPGREQGTVKGWLMEGPQQRMFSVREQEGAKFAITHYKVMDRTPDYTLMEIELETGRKNQIRVHLADLGCPVVGDRRYGADAKFTRRIRLHAFYLSLMHPVNGSQLEFKSKMPKGFLVLKAEDEKYG
jgi:23S rRNA pseudouridine1911/1915/1917 synthase